MGKRKGMAKVQGWSLCAVKRWGGASLLRASSLFSGTAHDTTRDAARSAKREPILLSTCSYAVTQYVWLRAYDNAACERASTSSG